MQIRKSKSAAYFDKPSMNVHAVTSQFKQFRTEVADAIREIEGTDDPINPKDFASKIKNMSGGSSDPFIYYKVNYDPFWDPEMGMDSSSAVSPGGFLETTAAYLNLYSFICSRDDGQVSPPLSRILDLTGSSDLLGDSLLSPFLNMVEGEHILGFCLCTKKHTISADWKGLVTIGEGGLFEQILTVFAAGDGGSVPDLSNPEISAELAFFKKAIDHLFIPITEEEYYALSNPPE